MSKRTPNYGYAVLDHGEGDTPDFKFFSAHGETDLKWIAEGAAEDYFQHHDGWEASWPLTFVIFDDDEKEIGRVLVQHETVPSFRAIE